MYPHSLTRLVRNYSGPVKIFLRAAPPLPGQVVVMVKRSIVWRRHKLSRGEMAGGRFWKTGCLKKMMGSLPALAAKTQGSTR